MNSVNSVAILREVYCRLAVKNLEPQLLTGTPLPETGCFFSHYLNQFHATITFGVSGLEGCRYSAQLQIYVPTRTLGEWPGDVYVCYTARTNGEGEQEDPPTLLQIFRDGPDETHHRSDLCHWLNERVLDLARESRLMLQRFEPATA
jgi:hypothetical protein